MTPFAQLGEMEKSSARWDKLLRSGKLSPDSVRRLDATPLGLNPMTWSNADLSRGVIGKLKKKWALKLRRRDTDDIVTSVRYDNNRNPLNTSTTAADYLTGDPDKIRRRLQFVLGAPASSFDNIPLSDTLRHQRTRFGNSYDPMRDRWFGKTRLLPKADGAAKLTGDISGHENTSWLRNFDYVDGLAALPAYDPSTNLIHSTRRGTPERRHEMGHFAQNALAKVAPERLNRQLMTDFANANKVQPGFLRRNLNEPTGLREFQAHALATSGSGPGAERLRNATAFGGSGSALSRIRATEGITPHVLSSLEHLARNYPSDINL